MSSRMCIMKRTLLVICLLAAVAGCRPVDQGPQPVLQSAEARQIELLRNELQTLETEKAMLATRVREMSGRAKQLEKKVQDLEFKVEQHKDTIVTLARAPIERDKYKDQLKKLEIENAVLKKQLEELKKQLAARQ